MLLLAVLALLTSSLTAGAQPTICQDVDPTNMISDFASWHWEVDRNDPTYCNTWAIRTGGNTKGKVYGAPWLHAQNGVLARIAADKDYTPAAGWVLLRMDLGGKTVVNIPYFILYNKYTSMIRSYFWLNNSAGTYNNGAVITLSHSSISRTSPATSLKDEVSMLASLLLGILLFEGTIGRSLSSANTWPQVADVAMCLYDARAIGNPDETA